MKYTSRWEMPEVTFYQVEDHGFPAHEGKPLYCYGKPGETNDNGIPKTGELFLELDRALVAWVGEKYTGPRGAGGTGVGTAADWFMRMIGADQLVEVDYSSGQKALQEAVADTRRYDGPIYQRARAISTELEKRGLVLATLNTGGALTADSR
jgi:hypothetical protein